MSCSQENMLRRGLVVLIGVSVASLAGVLRAADLDIRPVAASGVEGVDWVAGPGPNEITLFDGGQDVAVEIFILNLGSDNVAAYQFAQDCNYDFDISGSIDPNAGPCPAGDPFHTGACSGVDVDRPGWILAAAAATIPACATTGACPDGVTGKFICGAVLLSGSPGAGAGEFYGATFGFAVSADAMGSVTVGLDLAPTRSLLRDSAGAAVLIDNVTDGRITVQMAACCGVEALGSRYIHFTPPCGPGPGCDDTTLMALRFSGALPAPPGGFVLLGHVQQDGSIGDQPVFNTPAGWGSVAVSGGLIRPEASYRISSELQDGVLLGTSDFTMPVLGEVDGDGVATFADVLAVVQTFQGLPGTVLESADLAPCIPDGLVNFEDVQWAVFGFQERTFESLCPIGVCCICPGGCFDYDGFGQLQATCEAPGSDGHWTGGVSCAGFTCAQDCFCGAAPECTAACPAENSCVSDANCGPGSVCTPWAPELPCVPSGCWCDVQTGEWICLNDCGDQCVPGGG
ncbi:MAG: hypothetical protein ACE5E5_08370 [Phycisphaerae bacterium]